MCASRENSAKGPRILVARGDRLQILLAERSALLRDVLSAALSDSSEVEIVAEISDLRGAVDAAASSQPDVAMLGTTLTDSYELAEVIHALRERVPTCQLVILDDSENYENLLAGIEAGISGYITKKAPLSELTTVARAVHEGEAVIPGKMLRHLLDRLISTRVQKERAMKRLGRLTNRERQVLALLAQGADNEGIAEELVISPQTARTHIHNILQKLNTNSRLKAAAFVGQHDLLDELLDEESEDLE